MKHMRWTGLTPVTNIFGDWKPGEIKMVPDETSMPGFENFERPAVSFPPVSPRKFKKRKMREELKDKFERDNFDNREQEETK